MRWAGLLFIAVLSGNQLNAGGLEICLENSARLDEFTVQTFRTELDRIVVLSGRSVSFNCSSTSLTIAFRNDPPEDEDSALGRIRLRDGLFLPRIELFAGPVSHMIGSRLSGILGRALARVAVHELGHWLTRSSSHAGCGVMMERLSAAHLMASDRGFFRLPPGE